VSPAYEGWWPNEDGSFTLFFGYMNTNWLEELDVPIGPDNNIEPGGPDQGQPTHFYPRRNPFLFTIRVPNDFGNKELVWTLTTHGSMERVYASLKGDYRVDPQVIQLEVDGDGGSQRDDLRTNVPPDLKVEGNKHQNVRLGEPLTLVAFASDPDNLPARRDGRGLTGRETEQVSGQRGAPRAGPPNLVRRRHTLAPRIGVSGLGAGGLEEPENRQEGEQQSPPSRPKNSQTHHHWFPAVVCCGCGTGGA
jgi:autonomous glycyl radical cofactor GrcA